MSYSKRRVAGRETCCSYRCFRNLSFPVISKTVISKLYDTIRILWDLKKHHCPALTPENDLVGTGRNLNIGLVKKLPR